MFSDYWFSKHFWVSKGLAFGYFVFVSFVNRQETAYDLSSIAFGLIKIIGRTYPNTTHLFWTFSLLCTEKLEGLTFNNFSTFVSCDCSEEKSNFQVSNFYGFFTQKGVWNMEQIAKDSYWSKWHKSVGEYWTNFEVGNIVADRFYTIRCCVGLE